MAPKKKAKTPQAAPASIDELFFTARASLELSVLAEAIGEEKGRKASRMTGQDFINLLEEARERYVERNKDCAPSARALASAHAVQEQVIRIVRLLIMLDEPLYAHVHRVLSVWNVFNQEMERAAQQGTVEGIEAEARLFAQQVQDSPDR